MEICLVTVVGVMLLLSVGHVTPDGVTAKKGPGSSLVSQGEGHVSNAQWIELHYKCTYIVRVCVNCVIKFTDPMLNYNNDAMPVYTAVIVYNNDYTPLCMMHCSCSSFAQTPFRHTVAYLCRTRAAESRDGEA